MVDHALGHAAINGDIFPRDEIGIGRTEKEYRTGDIFRLSDAPGGMLQPICGGMFSGLDMRFLPGGGVNPAGCHAVHARNAGQAVGKAVRQCDNGAFCGRITFGIALGHEGACRGDIDDACAWTQVIFQQQRQIVRCGDADCERRVEILEGTAAEKPRMSDIGVVDQEVDAAIACEKLRAGGFKKGAIA